MIITEKERQAGVFAEYIREGIKDHNSKSLGVEVEHFVLDDKTSESAPYSGAGGVKESVEKLMSLYPDAEPIVGEDLLGFTTRDFNITLEPAAQIEISIVPGEDITRIGNIYTDFYEKLAGILGSMNKHLCTVGCQPVSHVDDLELIPKGRYRLMDEHFKKTGTGGREMMRGTASTQVSVDYVSEEDFRRKLQAAYYYMPLIKLVSDRCKTFQGEDAGIRMKRTDIWNRTDPARCGILPGVFRPDYGFCDYAEYLCTVPLIFLVEDGKEKYTGVATSVELFRDREIHLSDLEHIFSMPFPDVRVKRYLEIRGADAMSLGGVLFLCAFIKGLLYSEEVLDHVQKCISERNLTEKSVKEAEESLMQTGWKGEIYGIPAKDFLERTLKICEKNLEAGERRLLYGWEIV